jgi:hypothetical protein
MEYSVTFARHFARLVWLLLREPGNIDEQKAALRALVTVAADGAVTLSLSGPQQLTANGNALPGTLTAARELALRLGRMRGDFETVISAMTTEELKQTESLWLRLAVSHAALELLREEAGRLSQDPTASAAELHDLATQLSAALELASTCSRLAAQRVSVDSAAPQPSPISPPRSLPLAPETRRGQVSARPSPGPHRPQA